jgi:hypothetical protein
MMQLLLVSEMNWLTCSATLMAQRLAAYIESNGANLRHVL